MSHIELERTLGFNSQLKEQEEFRRLTCSPQLYCKDLGKKTDGVPNLDRKKKLGTGTDGPEKKNWLDLIISASPTDGPEKKTGSRPMDPRKKTRPNSNSLLFDGTDLRKKTGAKKS